MSTSDSSTTNVEISSSIAFMKRPIEWMEIVKNMYSLCSVLNDCPDVRKGVKPQGDEEHHLDCAVIKDWIVRNVVLPMDVVTNEAVVLFEDLQPIFSSQRILPDVVVYEHTKRIPVLVIEVHSSPYEQTLKKLALVLVEQLRLLRNGDPTIMKWTGFCFPKHSDKACVSQMEVSWDYENLQFNIDYSCLAVDVVLDAIRYTLRQQMDKLKTFNLPSGCLFGIPLGEEDLRNFEGGAYQVHSNASIIVCDGNNIYKHIIDIQEESSMLRLLESCPQKNICLPSGRRCYNKVAAIPKKFFVFPIRMSPMSREEAKKCLPNLIESVVKAIQAMHDKLQVAHLDIRLENVCFTSAYEG